MPPETGSPTQGTFPAQVEVNRKILFPGGENV